jgi:hypothetical protein
MPNQNRRTVNGAQHDCLVLLVRLLAIAVTVCQNGLYAQVRSRVLYQVEASEAFPDSIFPRRLKAIFGDRLKARFDCVPLDLNNDYKDEKLATIKVPGGDGTHTWLLFDWLMDDVIGEFEASIIYVLIDRHNGYYDLECFCPKGRDHCTVSLYVFDGSRYKEAKSSEFRGKQVDRFLQDHKHLAFPDELRPDK